MDDQQAAQLGDLPHRGGQAVIVKRRELRHARVDQEALEAEHPGLVQRGPVGRVGRDGAAPEPDVHGALPGRGLPLGVQRGDVGRRRDASSAACR